MSEAGKIVTTVVTSSPDFPEDNDPSVFSENNDPSVVPENNDPSVVPEKAESWMPTVVMGSAVVAGALICPPLVVAGVQAIGFGSAGIASGSWAAAIMSSYGGAVTSGSACAILQSIGAAGTGVATTVTSGSLSGFAAKWFYNNRSKQEEPESSEAERHAKDAEKPEHEAEKRKLDEITAKQQERAREAELRRSNCERENEEERELERISKEREERELRTRETAN
ncbi:hypothetical protein G9A89_013305 [Geosiphon pyriformis]|nr:hypothetical protein G9A89_013305 [Geosiphon pyriformis]